MAERAKRKNQQEVNARFRLAHPDVDRLTALRSKRIRRQFLRWLKELPCADCKQTYNPVCMDFDHVRGEKVAHIVVLIERKAAWARLAEEVQKCEIVCANCHRLRTVARMRKTEEI